MSNIESIVESLEIKIAQILKHLDYEHYDNHEIVEWIGNNESYNTCRWVRNQIKRRNFAS